MTSEAPQLGDEEFEARLSWTPPHSASTALQPARRVAAVKPGTQIDDQTGAPQDEEPVDLGARWQELRDEVMGVRADLANLRAAVTRLRTEIATVQGLVVDLTAAVPAHPSGEELDDLKKEMKLLRRRIGLRASATPAALDEQALGRLSEAATSWLAAQARSTPKARRRWRRSA